MNILKFKDIIINPDTFVEEGQAYAVKEADYWTINGQGHYDEEPILEYHKAEEPTEGHPEFWTIGDSGDQLLENPLPQRLTTVQLDFEVDRPDGGKMEGTWNKDEDENPNHEKPSYSLSDDGYTMIVSGDEHVLELDKEHYGRDMRTFTTTFTFDDNVDVENTMVWLNDTNYGALIHLMSGPGTEDEPSWSWGRGLYLTLPIEIGSDTRTPILVTFEYPNGVKEIFAINYKADGIIDEPATGSNNVKYTSAEDPSEGHAEYWEYDGTRYDELPEVVKVEVSDEDTQYFWNEDSIYATSGMTVDEACEWFNTNYRNKYAYAINWKWVITLDRFNEYIELSVEEPELPFTELTPILALNSFIDTDETNNLSQKEFTKYTYINSFIPEEDITIEDLKRFRTWLASILYANQPFIEEYTDDVEKLNKMLEYYKSNMNDCTIANLMRFTNTAAVNSITQSTGCGCGYSSPSYAINGTGSKVVMTANGSSTINAISKSAGCGCGQSTNIYAGISTSICDPISIYRTSIYNYMTIIFSDIDYWTGQPEICGEMKKYIDGIMKYNLPLASSVIDTFADCTCNNTNASEQERLMVMLSNLSIALGYIVEDNVSGNRNFITTAFTNWAKYLYELMYWV